MSELPAKQGDEAVKKPSMVRQAVRIVLLGILVGCLMFGAYLLASLVQCSPE